jgi:predicted amidohydrolase
MFKLALIQMRCSGSREENFASALAKIAEAAANGAQMICLPELFTMPYFPAEPDGKRFFAEAETIPGDSTRRLSEAAKQHGVYLIGGSLFERDGDTYYNTAPVFDDTGALIARYRKCHIPQDPGFYEKDYFAEGPGIEVIDTKYGRIAVMICFDQWFPEAARLAALQGASLLIYPTAIGMPDNALNISGDWRAMWQIAQQGHGAANNVYIAAINRVGQETTTENTTRFFGGSFVADYGGRKLVEAGDAETILYAECDFAHQKKVQAAWCLLANRRPSLYGALAAPKP